VPATRDIALRDVTPGDIESWMDLVRRAVEPNPFFEPAFLLALIRHLPDQGAALLVVEDAGAWLACLPVLRWRLGRAVPVLRTWRHDYCFLGTPLLDTANAAQAAGALLDGARKRAPGSRVGIDLLTEDGPAAVAIHRAARDRRFTVLRERRHERAFLARRPEDDYLAGMRSHRRRELNRLGRRLAAELDGELSVTDRAGDEAAVDTFLELEKSGWKGREATAMGSEPEHEAFFRDLCRTFAGQSRLQLLALSVEDRTVAMKCNLTAGDGAFCFKIAHDERLGNFSPGVQLERENVKVFHDQRHEQWQDSCADPENEMINRLWPDRRELSNTVYAPRGVQSFLMKRGLDAAQSLRDRRTSSATS